MMFSKLLYVRTDLFLRLMSSFSLQVHHVRLFAGEEIYSDLYLTVCEWPNDHSKIVIFGFK